MIGERILHGAPDLTHVAGLVRSSHERFDGTGYPDGLAGTDIPLISRIVFVCDAFDAMTSHASVRRRAHDRSGARGAQAERGHAVRPAGRRRVRRRDRRPRRAARRTRVLDAEPLEAGAQADAPVRQRAACPASRCAAPSSAGRCAGASQSALAISRTRQRRPASSKIASRELGPRAVAVGRDVVDAERQLEQLRQLARRDARRTSATSAGPRRPTPRRARAPSRSIVRTKLCDVQPKSADVRTIHACSPAAASPWSFVPAVRRERVRRVRLDVRLALRPVEDVVRRERDERRAERRDVRRAADVHRGGALRIALGAVDVGPGRGVQDDVRRSSSPAGAGSVTSQSARVSARAFGERLGERRAELAAGARYEHAAMSRSERIGSLVLQRCFTRSSAQQTPCSSGAPASYSSVTW